MSKVGIMPDSFFELTSDDRKNLLVKGASELAMQPFILEKDVWVCWALERLFSMPGNLNMAFKGGTSLSKVYDVIDRFSEDIDVTIDYRDSESSLTGHESRSELARLSERLKDQVNEITSKQIKPFFEEALSEEFGASYGCIELSPDGEKLYVHYESVLAEAGSGYLSPSVLLEFGGRNITEPNEKHAVRAYLAKITSEVLFPEPVIRVLALERTFWEKATLVHVECKRPKPRDASRISRHWYDLYRMSSDLERLCTREMHDLLESVVEHKKAFFHYSFAGYDDCLSGGLRLVPGSELQDVLDQDFAEMKQAGMFYQEPPSFGEILDHLQQVEKALNAEFKRSS